MKLRTFRGNGDGKIFSALSFRDLLLKGFFFVITALTKNYFLYIIHYLIFFGGVWLDFFPIPHPSSSFILNLPGIIIKKKKKRKRIKLITVRRKKSQSQAQVILL